MAKKFRRMLAVVMTFAMLFSLFNVPALAAPATVGSIAYTADRNTLPEGEIPILTRWEFVEPRPEDELIRQEFSGAADAKGGASPANVEINGHLLQIEALAAAIRSGAPVAMDGREGRRAVELVCGIYESARSGKPFCF